MASKAKSRTVTFRLRGELDRELDSLAARRGSSRTQLLTRYLEEGMRMDEHPGIVFRDGPAGRRPGVIGGPDVWEIARVLRSVSARDEKAVAETATLTGLAQPLVEVATRYYADHREEIDAWLEMIDAEAERARSQWERRNELLA